MTPLLLGQLVYTSFAGVGFRTLASTEVPPEVKQAFIQQIVYQYWDSYNPPSAGYCAAYLYQVTSEQNLFGWLYNDGLDDFGRSDVPYFVCYYLAGELKPIQLENIFICLRSGPVSLIDRQNVPDSLESVMAPDLWNYQATRPGVEISRDKIEQNQISLQQGELINLFAYKPEDSLAAITQKKPVIAPADSIIHHDVSAAVRSKEDYRQILLATTRFQDKHTEVLPKWRKSSLIQGLIATIVALLTVIVGRYYFPKLTPFTAIVPQISNSTLYPYNLTLTQTLAGHVDSVWSVLLTPNGETLVSASADKTIKIWNLNPGKIISTLKGHTDTVRAIALSQDGKILVSGSGDSTIKVWNFQTFEMIRTINPGSGPVWSVAMNSDGQTLVSGTEDGSIQIWNYHTGQLLRIIQAHESRVFSVAISPDGETLATGGLDKNIKIWNLYTGELIQAIAQHNDAVRSVVFSRDGKRLVSASWDQSIKIWDTKTGELLHTLLGHTSRVVTLSMGVDGQTLFSGSVDNTVKTWDMQTGKLLHNLAGHADWILDLTTNPDKQILVSSSKDKTIRIWQRQGTSN